MKSHSPDCQILLIAADPTEYRALEKVVKGIARETRDDLDGSGFRILRATFDDARGEAVHAILARPHTIGGLAAANIATRLVNEFSPFCLAMTGICAGDPRKFELGGVELAPEQLATQRPDPIAAGFVRFFQDSEELLPRAPVVPRAIAPSSFETFEREISGDGFRIVARVAVLDEDSVLTPCGLSFQGSAPNSPARTGIETLPDVRKRVYVGSVPMVNESGQVPNLQDFGFGRLFGPFDLYVEKPQLVDMDLSRSAFMVTPETRAFFERVDGAALQLITALFAQLRERGGRGFAERMFEEYWLQRVGRRCDYCFGATPVIPDHVARLRPLWNELRADVWDLGTSSIREMSLAEAVAVSGRILWAPAALWMPLRAVGHAPELTMWPHLQEVSGAPLVFSFPRMRRHLELPDVLLSQATGMGLVPVPGLPGLPPLLLLDYADPPGLPVRDRIGVRMLGSADLIVGLSPQGPTVLGTGAVAPYLMVNTEAQAVDEVRDALLAALVRANRAGPLLLEGDSARAFLASRGVPADLLERASFAPDLTRSR